MVCRRLILVDCVDCCGLLVGQRGGSHRLDGVFMRSYFAHLVIKCFHLLSEGILNEIRNNVRLGDIARKEVYLVVVFLKFSFISFIVGHQWQDKSLVFIIEIENVRVNFPQLYNASNAYNAALPLNEDFVSLYIEVVMRLHCCIIFLMLSDVVVGCSWAEHNESRLSVLERILSRRFVSSCLSESFKVERLKHEVSRCET